MLRQAFRPAGRNPELARIHFGRVQGNEGPPRGHGRVGRREEEADFPHHEEAKGLNRRLTGPAAGGTRRMLRQASGRQAGTLNSPEFTSGEFREMRGPRAAMAAGGGEKKKRISITMKKPKGGAV